LAPHRGVSRRLSGSLVFRSIGLILVFRGAPTAGVGHCPYDRLPPGIDIHPLLPVLRRCQNAADEGACSRPYCRAEALRRRLGCASGQGVTFYVRHATRQHDPPCWRRGSRAA
jgi:hypothetical protein